MDPRAPTDIPMPPDQQPSPPGMNFADLRHSPGWPEVESEIHRPGRWLFLLIGSAFVLCALFGWLTIDGAAQPGTLRFMLVFGMFGAVTVFLVLFTSFRHASIRHAAPEVLADVPTKPVTREGTTVSTALSHELVENGGNWELRVDPRLWRDQKRFLIAFGVPFSIGFAALFAWAIQRDGGFSPLVATFLATVVTVACGGTAFYLIGLMMRAEHRRQCRLIIPIDGGNLSLDWPVEPRQSGQVDHAEAIKWLLLGDTERQTLSIPRDVIVAVQLCPWDFVLDTEKSTTSAVQGLLVLKQHEAAGYLRLPTLLSADYVSAARLMRRLADVLGVPFLFTADRAGWTAEHERARKRSSKLETPSPVAPC